MFFNVSISIVLCLKHLFELYNINTLKNIYQLDRCICVFVLKLREKDMQLLPIHVSIRMSSNTVY